MLAPAPPDTWTFLSADVDVDGRRDVVGIASNATGSGRTEAHVLGGQYSWERWTDHVATGAAYWDPAQGSMVAEGDGVRWAFPDPAPPPPPAAAPPAPTPQAPAAGVAAAAAVPTRRCLRRARSGRCKRWAKAKRTRTKGHRGTRRARRARRR